MKKLSVYVLVLIAALLLVSCELTGTAPSKGTLHVVAIGDNFTNHPGVNPLLSCENDATAACQVFEFWGKMSGMKTDIHNCNGNYFQGFELELDKVINSSANNDLTILFLSSHGNNQVQYIVPYSSSNSDNEGVILETGPTDLRLLTREYFNSVADLIKGKVLIIADSCFSGAMIQQDYFTYNSENYTGSGSLRLFFDSTPATDSNRVFFLSASTYYQEAQAGYPLSMFTRVLLSSLGLTAFDSVTGEATVTSAAPVLKGKKIILSDILRYVYERTANVQVPQMNTGANDLILFSL